MQYYFFTTLHIINPIGQKECDNLIDYSPLWETMERKGITQYQMIEMGIDRRVLDFLRKNKNITLLTVEKICKILDCEIGDIVKFHD